MPLAEEWQFVVAMSGVHAAKGAAVRDRYNALAAEVATLVDLWNGAGHETPSLFQAIISGPGALATLDRIADESGRPDRQALRQRLAQFAAESCEIIPAVADRLAAGDVTALRAPVARSVTLAIEALRNQVPETIHLASSATALTRPCT